MVFRDLQMIKRGRRPLTKDRPPTVPELKLMLGHADLKTTKLILNLLSSDMRIGEATKITIDDVDLERKPAKIHIRSTITKTGEPRIIFVSDEAATYLDAWLDRRREYLKWANKITNVTKNGKTAIDDRVFPFTVNATRHTFNRLLRLTNLDQRSPETDRYVIHVHTLRKFFLSQMCLVVPEAVARELVGHEGYLSNSYIRYSDEELASYYMKGMDSVTIFEKKYPEEMRRLEAEINRKDERIRQIEKRVDIVEEVSELARVLKKYKKKNLEKGLTRVLSENIDIG